MMAKSLRLLMAPASTTEGQYERAETAFYEKMRREFVMAKRLEFVVSIEQPKGASVADVKAYIEDAVGTWSGQLRPPGADGYDDDDGDPLWGIGKTTKVKRLMKPRLGKNL